MKARITPHNSLLYLFGLLFLSGSVVLTFRTGFGASPADTLTVIVSLLTGWSKGVSAFLITATIIVFLTVYFRKPVFLILFAQILVFSLLIDFWDLLVFANYRPEGPEGIVPLVVSVLLMPLGCAFLIRSTYPAGVYDELMFFTAKVTRLRHNVARTLNESLIVLLALALSLSSGNGLGAVDWGTLVYALTLGTFIKWYIQTYDWIIERRKQRHEHS
jgi:uncharacterized membrane protein YczE